MISTGLLVVGVILTILLLFLLGAVISFRLKKPHSGKMRSEKEHLDRKKGVDSYGTSRKETGSEKGKEEKEPKKEGKWFWRVVIIAIGVTALVWSLVSALELRPAGMGDLGQKFWLQILIVWVTLGVLLALSEAPKMFQRVLGGVALALLVALPVWSSLSSPSKASTRVTRTSIPLASDPEASWPRITIPERGKSENIPPSPDRHLVMRGRNFLLHVVYQDGSECAWGQSCPDGTIKGMYVTNESDEPIIVSYAYAPG